MAVVPERSARWWVESCFAVAIASCLSGEIIHLFVYQYFQTPFFYEPFDTWMDWFNTAQFAHIPGAYDFWGTIYPPLSFVALKALTNGQCYTQVIDDPRNCDTYGIITLHCVYLLNVYLTARTFIKIDRRTALTRSFAISAGLPMVFALERGNIILLCYTCLLLAYGPLLKATRWRWFFAACAINFKIYLIGTIFALLLKRRWRWFEGALITTILVYLVSLAILGSGSPLEIYRNVTDFSSSFLSASPLDLMYASTYQPAIYVLNGRGFSVIELIGSGPLEALLFFLPVAVYSALCLIALAALAAAFRPTAVPMHRLIFLSIASALISSEAGHYTTMFLILFVFMESWKGVGRKLAIVLSYVLSLPADIPLFHVAPLVRESYLFQRPIVAEYAVGVGPFIRPGLILIVVAAISCVTLREVFDQLRTEGWRLGRKFPADLHGQELGRP